MIFLESQHVVIYEKLNYIKIEKLFGGWEQGLKSSLPSWEHRSDLPGNTRDFCTRIGKKTIFVA